MGVSGAVVRHRSSSSSTRWAQPENVSPGPALVDVAAHEPLDEVGEVVGGHLEAAHRAAEAGLVAVGGGEAAAEVHLEAGLLLAVDRDDHALEADVGDLDAGAGVGAAVDVQGDRGVERRDVGEPALELGDRRGGGGLGLDDRELAELDAGARHRVPAERARRDRQAEVVEAGDEGVDAAPAATSSTTSFWCGVSRTPVGARGLHEVGEPGEHVAADAADDRRGADVVPAVLLQVHADVVAGAGGRCRRRPVGQGASEVLGLEHLAEPLGAPLGQEELQAGLGAQPAVAVVAEDRDDAEPHVGRPLGRDEHAEPLGEARRRRQPAADPQVVAGAELGVDDPDERDVVDLVDDVEAGVPGDRGLELARQVGELGVADVALGDLAITGVGSMISSAAMPASGLPRMTRGVSPQASVVCSPTASRRRQISGTSSTRIQWYWMFWRSLMSAVPRANSVEMSARTRSWRQGQGAAVEADPQHEVLVGELGVVELGGAAAVDARLALGVQAPPAEPAAEVLRRDGGEALPGVDLLDALRGR